MMSKFIKKIENFFSRKLREIYVRTPWLIKIRGMQQRIKYFLSSLPRRVVSSSQNKLAHNELVRRRFNQYEVQKLPESILVVLPVIDLSVVTYNSADWVDRFFKSLEIQSYPLDKIAITLVDHGSKDKTIDLIHDAKRRLGKLFYNFNIIIQENRGFGAGHNRAIKSSAHDYILVSNIDLEFDIDSILVIVEKAKADDINVAAWEFRQVPHEHPKHYDPVTLETSWQSHACVLIRRRAFEKVGGYDDNIFMYGEDVELSYRFRSYGFILRYFPAALVRHYSYDNPNFLLKPLQYSGSSFANAVIRLRYGTLRDRFAVFILMVWRVTISKQPFHDSRRANLFNLLKIIRKFKYFTHGKGACLVHYPFRSFGYEMQRFGASYNVNPIACGALVSIITRTYDAEGRAELLEQAGRSIANQTYKNIEWIVVQDGGDSHRNVSLSVANKTPWLIVQFICAPKKGRSFAGNLGLEQARGEYCMFLDDDDLLYADHVETLISALKRTPDAKAAYALSFEVKSDFVGGEYNEYTYTTSEVFHQPWDYFVLKDHNFIPIQAILFSRSLFLDRGGFDLELEQLEDWNLWLRYGFLNLFVFVPKTTSLFKTPYCNAISLERIQALHGAYEDAKNRAMVSIQKYTI